jgi:hypothetical protein
MIFNRSTLVSLENQKNTIKEFFMKLLTIAETAMRLRTSVERVKEIIKTDADFPSFTFGKKSNRVIAEKLTRWVAKQPRPAFKARAD